MLAINLEIGNVAEEVNEIIRSASKYMFTRFERILSEPPKSELTLSYDAWHANVNSGKVNAKIIWSKFDLCNEDGLRRLFVAKERQAICDAFGEASNFLEYALRYAKEGSNSAQFNPNLAWTATGFGFWAQVTPEIALKLTIEAKRVIELNNYPCNITGLPHLVMRPVESKPLGTHFDGIPPLKLMEYIKEHLASTDTSTKAWGSKHGMQALVHLKGGTSSKNGATFTYYPLDVHTLSFIMNFLHDGEYDENKVFGKTKEGEWKSKKKFFEQTTGPYFCNLDIVLDRINNILKASKMELLRKVPIVPTSPQNPILIAFPVGFFHGAFGGKHPRFTFTVPIVPQSTSHTSRVKRRLMDLAIISSQTEGNEFEASYKRLKEDKRPLNDGATHKSPQIVTELFSRVKNGPFSKVGPSVETAHTFIEHIS